MPALLVLPEERIAQEIRRSNEVATDEHARYVGWRQRVLMAVLWCGTVYVAGLVLAWASLALGGDNAQMALWGGLLLSNAGPLVIGYVFWMRESGQW